MLRDLIRGVIRQGLSRQIVTGVAYHNTYIFDAHRIADLSGGLQIHYVMGERATLWKI